MPNPIPLDIQGDATLLNLPGTQDADPNAGFVRIVGNLLEAVMIIALLMVLLYLVWGAIDWIVAAGDKGKLEAARNKMMNAVLGIIVLASTIAIFLLVQYFLGTKVFDFTFTALPFSSNA